MTENRGIIEIPTKSTDEVIEIELDDLPNGSELIQILISEEVQLSLWLQVAQAYYTKNKITEFEDILGCAIENANTRYEQVERDQMLALNRLAAFYVQRARQERSTTKREDYIKKATHLYSKAAKIKMYEPYHLLGRAYLCLLDNKTDKLEQSSQQFQFVLRNLPNSIPAILGKAGVSFSKGDYRGALGLYRQALRLNPYCLPSIRLGIAYCQLKLKKPEQAKLAFERVLQLQPECVDAMMGLALLLKNSSKPDQIKQGNELLSKAYRIHSTNPQVLNHLANLFSLARQDYDKAQKLALLAYRHTDDDGVRAESCFHIARALHAQNDFENAFKYYYQSTQLLSSTTGPVVSNAFVLPYFGLGQMYIQRGETNNAIKAFARVLEACPNNYEAMRILGSLHAQTGDPADAEKAKSLLHKVVETKSADCEAWLELGGILECDDPKEALVAYNKVVELLDSQEVAIPPQILNNIGALHQTLAAATSPTSRSVIAPIGANESDPAVAATLQAKTFYERALAKIADELANNLGYYKTISLTVKYNQARLAESQGALLEAESIYQGILRQCRTYLDCYLRLGCMARDRGNTFEATDLFKEVLQLDQDNPQAWSLMGNLHMAKREWNPAQKKFERILERHKSDSYALVSLGNIMLARMHHSQRSQSTAKAEEHALSMYKAALKIDPANIWACNGIACVMAHKGFLTEARDLFAQVREATARFLDVWINIAHIHIEQKSFVAAEQMYDNCIRRFGKEKDLQCLLYLGRAFFKSGKLLECRSVLLRAKHMHPAEPLVSYNLSLVLQKLSAAILADETASLRDVLRAVRQLQVTKKTLSYLAQQPANMVRYPVEGARLEVQACGDLLSQAQYYVKRAKTRDELDRESAQRQARERANLLAKEAQLAEEEAAKKRAKLQEIESHRQECREKAKSIREAIAAQAPRPSARGNRDDADEWPDEERHSKQHRSSGEKRRKREHKEKRDKPTHEYTKEGTLKYQSEATVLTNWSSESDDSDYQPPAESGDEDGGGGGAQQPSKQKVTMADSSSDDQADAGGDSPERAEESGLDAEDDDE